MRVDTLPHTVITTTIYHTSGVLVADVPVILIQTSVLTSNQTSSATLHGMVSYTVYYTLQARAQSLSRMMLYDMVRV